MKPLPLPLEVVENIIWWARPICKNDDYFRDLRLVNHQFNEAVIYTLFFCDNANAQPAKSKSRLNHRPSCLPCSVCQTSFGRFNTTYARMRLQAQLNLQAGPDCSPLREWHDLLREAISVLKSTLAGLHLYSARHRIEADPRFLSSSSHPVLAERTSLMLCDAVVNVLDIAEDGRLKDWHEHSPKGRLHLAPPSFWIMATAYHIGDMDLIKKFLLDPSFMKSITDSKCGSLTMCLRIAARQGREDILLYVMNNYLKDVRYNKSLIMAEACIAGQAECARLLQFAFPAEEDGIVFSDALGELRRSALQPAIIYQAFELLVDQCKSVLSSDKSIVLLSQTQGQKIRILKMLQERDWGQWKTTIVQSPCKADYRCKMWLAKFEQLLVYWRHLPTSKEEIENLCRTTAELAIDMNRVDMAEALYEYIGQDIASMDLRLVMQAGAVDCGICILRARDLKEPRIWHKSVSNRHQCVTVGQATLRNAINRLQAENAQFMLERGVRLPKSMMPIKITWRYRRTRDRQYQAVQQLLGEYNMRPVLVVWELSSTWMT